MKGHLERAKAPEGKRLAGIEPGIKVTRNPDLKPQVTALVRRAI